jgi:hypothetical protein
MHSFSVVTVKMADPVNTALLVVILACGLVVLVQGGIVLEENLRLGAAISEQ